ncbi:MAG: helix-turn-helix transcriptional regulator [Sneathiellaceae bacterium]
MTAPTRDVALLRAIACRLRWHIRRCGHNVLSFSRASGIPHSTLHDYLSGRRKINVAACEKLGRMGIDTHWLLTGRQACRYSGDLAQVCHAVTSVLDDPCDYSDSEVEFAAATAERLREYGAAILITPAQATVVAGIAAHLARRHA